MTDFESFTKTDGTEVTAEQQKRMAEKIGKLIAMAEDETLPPEARASYAEKAEKLMREYRVNEENVISSGSEAATVPQKFEIIIMENFGGYYSSEFRESYMRIWQEISKHAGLRSHMEYRYDKDDDDAMIHRIVAIGYGYEIDIRLSQFLWTSAHLTFATRIEAKVDRSLSDQLNCYYMRASGQERNDIATALWGSGSKDGAAHGKVQKLYIAECAARGEAPLVGGRGFIAKRYRESYANAFVDQFGWRLRDARSAVDAEKGTLVLKGRSERIDEAYYTEWPDRRPQPMDPAAQAARQAAQEARWAAEAEELKRCKESGRCSKAKSGECRAHRTYEASEADRRRWDREAHGPEARAGRRAGTAAASSVDFSRTGGERRQKAGSAERRALN